MSDSERFMIEIERVHTALSRVAAGRRGKRLIDDLRSTIAGTPDEILRHALLADCLRVAHCAVAADGEIETEEIAALHGILCAAAVHYAKALPTRYGEFASVDDDTPRAFLDRYAADTGPFGRGDRIQWPGLVLCRRAVELGDRAPLDHYRTTMTGWIAETFRIGRVVEAGLHKRGRIDEIDELRGMLTASASPTADLRVEAFLSPNRVFTAVQQASSIFENDPFDVDTIHAEARSSFEQLVARAITPSQITDRGRMMLLLGDSGAGKTHVLRGFRRHVQEHGRGFVAYAQLQSGTDNYARYLLYHLIDSLSRRYSESSGETGLRVLASGLMRLVSPPLKVRMKRLIDDAWDTKDSLTEYVNRLVDDLLEHGDLASFDPDLLRVMLYALRPHAGTTSRVYKYLRCEDMSPHDRQWIGDVVPRKGDDHPHWMIRELGRLASITHRALVLMVDQADLAGYEASSTVLFRRALDALYRIVSEVPSAIAVVACLTDVYEVVRGELNRPALDRLENDPPIGRLRVNRPYTEIEAVVAQRLSWLFTKYGTVHRPEAPIYPIPEAELRGFHNRRLRDALEWCHQYQTRCALAGEILDSDGKPVVAPPPPRSDDADLAQIAAAWNDATLAQGIDAPDEDEEILAVLDAAIQTYAGELGLSIAAKSRDNGVLRVQLVVDGKPTELAIAVANNNPRGGGFTGQINTLLEAAGGAMPIAVRTLEFPRGAASDKAMAQLVKARGRGIYFEPSTLRAVLVFQQFQPPFPADRMAAWQQRHKPISSLTAMAELFDPERMRSAALPEAASASPPVYRGEALAVVAESAGGGSDTTAELPRRVRPPKVRAAGTDVPPRATRAATAPPIGPTQDSAGSQATTASDPAAPTEAAVAAGSKKNKRPRAPVDAAETQAAPSAQLTDAESNSQAAHTPEPTPCDGAVPTAIAEAASTDTSPVEAKARERIPRTRRSKSAASGAMPAIEEAPVRPAATEPPPPIAPLVPATTPIHIGNSTSFEAEPLLLEPASLTRHVGILGAPTIKATLALTLIEHALERDVAVIVLDRRGELAGHARLDWWQRLKAAERARRLAERLDVRLFTPGNRTGRSLSLPVVHDLTRVPERERPRLAQQAASAIAATLRLGDSAADAVKLPILTQAIAILGERAPSSGIDGLIALIKGQDESLVAQSGRPGDRWFKRLADDLEIVRRDHPELFEPAVESLTADALLGRRDGKLPLAIVSTAFLGDASGIQSWVGHLLSCLVHDAAKHPSNELRALLVLNDAELLMPTTVARVPSKDLLQDLLKNARTAGLGAVLASHSQVDFDCRTRDMLETWFLGRVEDPKSLDKMKPLYEHLPRVRNRLSLLEPTRCVMLKGTSAQELEPASPLVRPEALSQTELLAIAAGARSPSLDGARPLRTDQPPAIAH